jgi:hypothetical protein
VRIRKMSESKPFEEASIVTPYEVKIKGTVSLRDKSTAEDLIAGCAASGVKTA